MVTATKSAFFVTHILKKHILKQEKSLPIFVRSFLSTLSLLMGQKTSV